MGPTDRRWESVFMERRLPGPIPLLAERLLSQVITQRREPVLLPLRPPATVGFIRAIKRRLNDLLIVVKRRQEGSVRPSAVRSRVAREHML
jgi:hypothetical protein